MLIRVHYRFSHFHSFSFTHDFRESSFSSILKSINSTVTMNMIPYAFNLINLIKTIIWKLSFQRNTENYISFILTKFPQHYILFPTKNHIPTNTHNSVFPSFFWLLLPSSLNYCFKVLNTFTSVRDNVADGCYLYLSLSLL